METIVVDAEKIMNASDPLQAIAALFGVQKDTLEGLRLELQSSEINRIVEVENWPSSVRGWEAIADMLEGVQQHSSYFYLIWGTQKDFVNVHADSRADVLIDPPAQND